MTCKLHGYKMLVCHLVTYASCCRIDTYIYKKWKYLLLTESVSGLPVAGGLATSGLSEIDSNRRPSWTLLQESEL